MLKSMGHLVFRVSTASKACVCLMNYQENNGEEGPCIRDKHRLVRTVLYD